MTEAQETAIENPPVHRPNRLNQVAAWVGIVAGVVFIAASIFFTGFVLGQDGRGGHGPRHLLLHGEPGPRVLPLHRGPGPREMGPPPGPETDAPAPPAR